MRLEKVAGRARIRIDYDELAAAIGELDMESLFQPLLLRSFHVLRRHGPVFAALLSHAMAISSDGVVQDTAVQNFVQPDHQPLR